VIVLFPLLFSLTFDFFKWFIKTAEICLSNICRSSQ
jgi:hypothetical protein